jgi:hypothetical protein
MTNRDFFPQPLKAVPKNLEIFTPSDDIVLKE